MRKALLVLAGLEVLALLLVPAPANPDKPGITGGLRTAAAQLRGSGPPIDLVQDYVGARTLVDGGEPYDMLTRAYARVGLTWPAEHRSTHPPSAFVVVLPVAWLRWGVAAAVWGVLMLAAITASWWAIGARWEFALALGPATLLWPTAAWSLGQLTPVWLLGIALAWRYRADPSRAGVAIGVAGLTKLVPVISLVPFLLLRQLRALAAAGLVGAFALGVLLALRADVLSRYLVVARDSAREQASRADNAALLWAFGHELGAGGVAAAAMVIVAVFATALWQRGTEWAFWAWAWTGVAVLPIAWIYSLLPLLPIMVFTLRRGRVVASVLVLLTIVIPFTIDPFGTPGAFRLASAVAAAGLALLALAYAQPASAWRARLR